MSRDYDYINISKPRSLSPGLSHDLQLLRDLEIANARTAAELGPLPPGGLPVVSKPKFIPPQSAATPAQAQANFDSQEEKAMKLSQMVTVAALMTGVAACEPSSETGTIPSPSPSIAPTSDSQMPSVATVQPKEATVAERATARAIPEVPSEIRAFVPLDSTLLAYRRFDFTGDGNEDAVLIVRHPVTETYADYSKNPCDLIVLHNEGHDFKLAAKGSKIIDCTYKNFERERASRSDDLNHLVELKLREIIYHNEKERPGNATFRFELSKTSGLWHLGKIEVVYVRSGEEEVEVVEQIASYPRDFGLITMDEFDPWDDKLNAVLLKNEKEVE